MPATHIAIAVVLHRGQVLVGQRPEGAPLAGAWEFPGGKVLPGETPAAAAARECWEETGLSVAIGALLDETEHTYPHGQLRLQFFSARPQEPAATPRAPFHWVPVADLDRYAFPPANASVVAKLRAAGPMAID